MSRFTLYKFATILFLLNFILISSIAQKDQMIDSLQINLEIATSAEDSLAALCHLTWNSQSSSPNEASRYGLMALALAEKSIDPQQRSEAYDAGALAYWIKGDFALAQKYYTRSLEIGIEHHLYDRIAWCNYNLAQICMNQGEQSAALEHIRTSQNAFEEAEMYAMMINSYWLMAKMESGDQRRNTMQALVEKLKALIPKTTDNNTLLFYYLDIARIYSDQGKHSESLNYLLNALELAETSNSIKGLSSAYLSIGDYLRDIQQNHQLALQYFQRTLAMYQENNVSWGEIDALLEIGLVYTKMHDDSLAFAYFSEAMVKAEQMGSKYYEAKINNAIGELYFRNGDLRKAEQFFQMSFKQGRKNTNAEILHMILMNLGKVNLALSSKSDAYSYLMKSLSLADSVSDSRLRAISQISLGEYAMEHNDNSRAEIFFLKAEENARSALSLNLQIQCTEKLALLYSNTGDYQKAYSHSLTLRHMEDSLAKRNETNNLTRLENLFELENLRMQKEVDRAVSDAKIKQQVLIRNVFFGGFILTTLLGLYLFISFRRKKKQNNILSEQKEQIEEMSKKIHEVDEMKLQFFTNISHELRTPLTLITGLAEQLTLSGFDKKNLTDKLNTIHKNASRLHTLVNQILDIRKLDNGGSTLNLVQDDLIKYVGGVISTFKDYALEKQIDLVFVAERSRLITQYDFEKLDKILSNLLSNALNFCEKNDTIRITLYTKESHPTQCIIEVNDSGKGIPADQLKFIFQPFYQASNAQGGSGLGLALVRELVRVLNGNIEVDSQLEKGTRITLRLPIEKVIKEMRVPDSTKQAEDTPPEKKKTPENRKHPVNVEKTLLIVEDNADLQDFITDILKEDFFIYNALNGEAGRELACKHIPDVIISDIMMPGIDGIQLCDELKNNPCTSHIPILMLTAKTDQESMLRSFKTGADDYIVKPFSAAVLKTRVQNLVAQRLKLIKKFSQQFQVEPTEIILPDADKEFLEKVIQVIEKNISESTLDIDFLASEMCVSRTQLYRKLKALTDLSGNQFIRTIRLKRAAQLLSHDHLSIAEIMQETGFSNYSHFNTCFKEQFNESPKEYVKHSKAGRA